MHGQKRGACAVLSKNPEKKRPLAEAGINVRIKIN